MFDLVLNGHIRVGKLDFPIQLELFSSSPTKPLIGGYILLAGSTDGSNSSPLGHLKCPVGVLVLLFLEPNELAIFFPHRILLQD